MDAGNGQRVNEAPATVDSGSTARWSALTAHAGCSSMDLFQMGSSFFTIVTIADASILTIFGWVLMQII